MTWFSIAACTWAVGRLLTQDGSWLCQTSVWPRTRMLWDFAKLTILSPGPKLKLLAEDSVVSHFISLPGVTMSNWVPATAVSAELFRSFWVTAVPK